MRRRPVEKIIDTKRLGTDKKRYTYLRTSTMTTKLRIRLYRLYVVGNLIDLTIICNSWGTDRLVADTRQAVQVFERTAVRIALPAMSLSSEGIPRTLIMRLTVDAQTKPLELRGSGRISG
jgi:hypothetical protein